MILISGIVIHGDSYGNRLGFPTANLDRRHYSQSKTKLKFGVYAGTAVLPNGKKYLAGIVIGPLDRKKLPKLEAHLLGFHGNLYGRKLVLQLYTYVRPFKKYSSVPLLQQQIRKDLERIKKLKTT